MATMYGLEVHNQDETPPGRIVIISATYNPIILGNFLLHVTYEYRWEIISDGGTGYNYFAKQFTTQFSLDGVTFNQMKNSIIDHYNNVFTPAWEAERTTREFAEAHKSDILLEYS